MASSGPPRRLAGRLRGRRSRLPAPPGVEPDYPLGRVQTAHARPLERRLVAQPQRPAGRRVGHVERHRQPATRNRVLLAAEVEWVDTHLELQPSSLAGVQVEPTEIEDVGPTCHTWQVSPLWF